MPLNPRYSHAEQVQLPGVGAGWLEPGLGTTIVALRAAWCLRMLTDTGNLSTTCHYTICSTFSDGASSHTVVSASVFGKNYFLLRRLPKEVDLMKCLLRVPLNPPTTLPRPSRVPLLALISNATSMRFSRSFANQCALMILNGFGKCVRLILEVIKKTP